MASGKRPLNLRFGGWYSYQEWAEHGFTPKSVHEKPPPAPEPAAEHAGPPEAPPGGSPVAEPPEAPADGSPVAEDAGRQAPSGPARPPGTPPRSPQAEQARWSPEPVRMRPDDLYPSPPTGRRPDEPLIRPYIITGGRTTPRHDLDVHALVHTTEEGRTTTRTLPAEQDSVRLLCQSAKSVAEVASLVRVPLGVARIIIDDMEEQSLVAVTRPPEEGDHSVELLTRVLEGLQRL